jgi:hypothetical protein
MTKLELIKYEKSLMKIADTVTFDTSYENDLWATVSKGISVYGESKYGKTKVQKGIEKISEKYNLDPMIVCDDIDRQVIWFQRNVRS